MAWAEVLQLLSGELLEDGVELGLADLCRTCDLPAEQVFELVDEGIIQPLGRNPASWRFHAVSVQRVRSALRLQRDLGINLAGAALALELLEELERLRAHLRRLET